MELSKKKCIPCEAGTKPLLPLDIEKFRKELKLEWDIIDHAKIRRVFKFKDFKQAIAFVNEVADIAEFEGHHPDISVHWNKVTIELWTHAIGGLSENDFIVASKIEAIEIV